MHITIKEDLNLEVLESKKCEEREAMKQFVQIEAMKQFPPK